MKKYYKYVTEDTTRFQVEGESWHMTYLTDSSGKIWGSAVNSTISIMRGYATDGCSPKLTVRLFGKRIRIGVWDGFKMANGEQQLREASLHHDIMVQFRDQLKVKPKKYNRKFYEEMQKVKFPLAFVYYMAVSLWSSINH